MIELLEKAEIFSKLKRSELEVIAQYSEYLTFQDDEVIFSAGDPSYSLYIIQEGEVRIIANAYNGGGQEIAHFIKGETFGELDLFENSERPADAVADSDTVLLSFPREGVTFADILEKHPEICAEIVYKFLAIVAGRIRLTNNLVSEKNPWIEDIRKQILYDNLTGLYNRSFLDEDFKKQLYNYGLTTSILAIKPDNFKLINDGYGHEAGDAALRLLADAVKSNLQAGDIVVRYRGDEFMAILPNQDAEQAVSIAGNLLKALYELNLEPIIHEDGFHFLTSVGISTYPANGSDPADLVRKAYDKMFEARASGGNKILLA